MNRFVQIQIKKSKQIQIFGMDQDFFEEGEYHQAPQQNHQQSQSRQNNEDNVWEQAQPQITNAQLDTAHTLGSQNAYYPNTGADLASSNAFEIDDQVTRKIREQQGRIQDILRQKGDKQHEQKQARKGAGKQQIQQFFQKKQKQKEQRRKQNIAHEKQIIEKAKQLNQTPGWKKVFQNLNLKLGEYKGSKPVNRMRQSIINKRQDQKNIQ